MTAADRSPVARTLGRAALAGGLGGLANAALCLAGWPVPVATFEWHLLPAGFAHGAILAGVAVAAAPIGARWRPPMRWAASVAVGLVANLSWFPVALSLHGALELQALVSPDNLGAVSALLYLWLAQRRVDTRPWVNLLAGCAAGTLGSLWFWAGLDFWYLSPLHGSIWGCLVGLAVSGRHRAGPRPGEVRGDERSRGPAGAR